MIARLKQPSGPPNAVIAKGRDRGNIFKEVRVFEVAPNQIRFQNEIAVLPIRLKFYQHQRKGNNNNKSNATKEG